MSHTLSADPSTVVSRSPSARSVGLAAVTVTVVTRALLGNLVVNEWPGWQMFLENAVAAVVEGIVLGLLVFALVVRRALRGPNVVRASVVLALVAFLGLAVPYSAHQLILGAAVLTLGVAARERTTSPAAAFVVASGLAVIAAWVAFVLFAVLTGDWPIDY
ncbi:hypothetical protein [Knoellia sinensis]|nr:hypothetical protein [Knoellia sinensis]